MLNLTEIAARIKQPELCVASDIDSLKILCETYPYAQIFPLLYLKTLAQTNDVRLDSELQKFAFRISNRTVLFDLLHRIENSTKQIESPFSPVDVAQETIAQEVQQAPIAVNQTPLIEQADQEKIKKQEEAEAIDPSEPVQQVEETFLEVQEQPRADLPSIEDDLLLTLNLPSEIYSLEKEELQQTHEDVQQKNAGTTALDVELEKQKLIAALTAKKPLLTEQNIAEKSIESAEKQVIGDEPRSFTSWLKSNTQTSATPKQEDVEPKVDSNELIDRFIQTKPKISAAKEKLFADRTDKKELFNPTKKAKESLDDSQLPVSETLAKIFAAQGNYPKAISAYQQLMLIFPEKKVFFASQIEDLNKKLNT